MIKWFWNRTEGACWRMISIAAASLLLPPNPSHFTLTSTPLPILKMAILRFFTGATMPYIHSAIFFLSWFFGISEGQCRIQKRISLSSTHEAKASSGTRSRTISQIIWTPRAHWPSTIFQMAFSGSGFAYPSRSAGWITMVIKFRRIQYFVFSNYA